MSLTAHRTTTAHAAGCLDAWVTHSTNAGAPGTTALRGVSVDVPAGQMAAVVGPSGSGKSTLLHALSGLLSVDEGRVALLGQDITDASPSQVTSVHRMGVGFIFQAYNLVPSLPVIDNVLLPERFARRRTDRRRAVQVLDRLGIGHRLTQRSADLSGGEQQRVAVARVLYQRPQVVFADEPTGALDSETGRIVLDELRALADAGSAVVLVTHDLQAAALADRAVVLHDGQVTADVPQPRADDLWHLTRRESAHA